MYQPILKGKKAEFEAWKNLSPARRRRAVPLFELVADKGTSIDLAKFRDLLLGAVGKDDVVAVDALALGDGATEPNSGLGAYTWLSKECASLDFTLRPVLHVDDSPSVVEDVVRTFGVENITLRVGGTEGDPQPDSSDESLREWCHTGGLETKNVHLLIDFASIYGMDPAAQQGLAYSYLSWAASNGQWASVTLASGAFPQQITGLAKGVPNKVPRGDAALWNLVRPTSPVADLQFGDYGIRHPELADGGFGGPLPNLRYATATDWIVWREAKHHMYPNGSFYAVCAGVRGLPSYGGAGFSWADGIIDVKSRERPGPLPGAGTGTEWISYGMNRHFEFVTDRLTTLGVA